ncbi:DUF5979 domain-containing protein [Microbacterium sp. NPDC019599]|uniref:DUF5979 domain-containing protein n=1 Tax=Microbacterium sp. NPDC019599 TaxID=3154690 RepID=UPI0033D4F81F
MHQGRRRLSAAFTALVLAAATVLAGAAPAAVAADGDVLVQKTASVQTVSPGETFSYTIAVSCTTILQGCTNAILDDSVPSEFTVLGATIGPGLQGDVSVDGQDVHVDFTMPIVGGTTGIPAGTSGIVTIQVQARDDLPYEANGIPVPNTATTDADTQQSGPLDSTAEVTPVIPLDLATTVDKTLDPPSAVADPGTPVTATITATNSSNANVDQIVITDPVDPTVTPNPFTTLPFTGIQSVSYPAGAETAQVLVWDGAQWVPGTPVTPPTIPQPPAGVPDDQVLGVQIVFTSTTDPGIEQGATAGAVIGMEHGPDVQDSPDNVTVTNSTESEVSLDGTIATDDDAATHQIIAEDVQVSAGKSFNPTQVPAGGTSVATLTAGNQSAFSLPELTITEPSLTGDDPFADGFDESLQFTGFTGAVQYPAGATAATVTYYYDDGTSETLPFANGTTPPAPSGTVVRFQITFTGDIAPSAQTSIPFGVATDPDQVGFPATIPNEITVEGTGPIGGSGTATADADLSVFERHLEIITGKSIYPDSIVDRPGEWALVTLSGTIADFPRSTTNADQVVIQDPQAVPYDVDGTFWDEFDATEITQTAVPANATLSINYWDGTQWVPLPGAQDIQGPTTPPQFSMDIPADLQDDILGLQFVYTAQDGETFPPGTSFEPHFTVEKRATERDPATQTEAPDAVPNCASSSGSSPEVASTPTPDSTACDDLPLIPTDGGGGGGGPDVMDKSIEPNVITSRSQQQATITLDWSTGGFSSVDSMTIQDEAIPPLSTPASIATSFYDAFDVVAVPAISSAMDPLLLFDQVAAVQLWDGTTWRDLANDPCPAACDGAFPGVTLTTADRDDALGIRLVFVESPTRATTSVGDPTAPPVGSGVARSSGNDRQVLLTVELRDTRRSDGAPAMGTLDYNIADNDPAVGTVLDTASAVGVDGTDTVLNSQDSDTIAIIDVPLNVTLGKTWSNSPFGVPPDGTPQSSFPTGRVTLVGTNQTAAKVDTMTIQDPAPGAAENPFTFFNLIGFLDITIPPGADPTQTVVTLSRDTDDDGIADGSTTHTVTGALALTEPELADVVGVLIEHHGRINPGAASTVTMDLRLREFVRGTPGVRVDQDDSPVDNQAVASIDDAGGGAAGNVTSDTDTASVDLTELDLTVDATKSFSPNTQVEPDDSPVLMTLTGQPTGSSRTYAMRIEDSAPTFWNAFDFVGVDPSYTLTAPINLMRMSIFTGGTFTEVGGTVVVTGGAWQVGPFQTLAQFEANPFPFPGVDPADVQGIRFGFMDDDDGDGIDGAQWENPTTPLQSVPVLVQRRVDLRTGGAVPSDRPDLTPAPGEAAPGEFSNQQTTTICPFLSCDIEDPDTQPIAQDSATAQMFFQHATSAVEITKSPTQGSAFGPAEVIPYQITVTNTGEWPIENPVITDDPLQDGQLRVDPFDDAGDGTFRFDLSGAAAPSPPNGLPMPEDVGNVTIDPAGGQFVFTFPAGTVLEVGQSYTISIDLMFTVGLPGGTNVGNEATVSGDRPFDACNDVEGAVDECTAGTEVTVLAAGAVRSGKGVRVLDPELGSFDVLTGDEDCAPNVPPIADPDDEGFAWVTCVPRSKPGGEVDWRMAIVNTGNIPMDRLVMIDRLPVPGDTGVISGLDRESEWQPIFNGGVELVQSPAGATMSYQVTTGDVCSDDLDTTMTPTCPPGSWVDPATVADLSTITGLKVVIDLAPGFELMPGDGALLDYRTITPPVPPDLDNPDTIAWNTVATGAHLTQIQSNGSFDSSPIEGSKTGVALATGSIQVQKTVSGNAAEFAPATFDVRLLCVSAVGTPVQQLLPPIDLTLTADEIQTVEPLPWGAECELIEGDNGQIGASGSGGVVVSEEPFDTVTLDNVYGLAGLRITKAVQSDAVDAEGQPIEFGPFEVAVDCTFLGEPVWADGYDATPMVIEVEPGVPVELTGFPANTVCNVSETDTGGADDVVLTGTTATDVIPPNPDGSVTITLGADDGEIFNAVAVTNTFDVGSIALTKVITPVDTPFADPPYIVHVTCTFEGITTWDGDLVFAAAADDPTTADDETDLVAQVDDIVAGSSCEFEETVEGSATTVAIDPNPVTVGSGEIASVTVTNTFEEGSVTVVKEFVGDDLTWAADSYEVTIVCLDLSTGFIITDIPGGMTRTLTEANGWSATYDPLPAGALCLMGETMTGGANSSQILDENGDPVTFWLVEGDDARQFTVENTYSVGSLTVEKSLEGEPAASLSPATEDSYEVSLSCTYVVDGEVVDVSPIPGGATRTITGAGSVTYESLPTGAECTVAETDPGFASDHTISPDQPVIIGDDTAPVVVEVENIFVNGSVSVVKTVDAPDGFPVPDEFTATVSCTWQGAEVPLVDGGVVTLVPGADPIVILDVPVGSICTVAEDDQGQTDAVVTPETVTVAAEDQTFAFSIENVYEWASLEIGKLVESDSAFIPTQFEFHVVCTFEGETVVDSTFALDAGQTETITEIPARSECTITETDAHQADDTIIAVDVPGGEGELAPQIDEEARTVVIPELPAGSDTIATVTYTNLFDTSALVLRKEFAGAGAEQFGVDETFVFDYSCTFDGQVVLEGQVDLNADNGWQTAVTEVVAGSLCTVSEVDLNGADAVVITPNDGVDTATGVIEVPAQGGVVTITATNWYLTGSLEVTKTFAGAGAEKFGTASFLLRLVCERDGETVEIPGTGLRTVNAGDPIALWENLPTGSTCTLTEVTDGGANSTAIYDADGNLIAADAGEGYTFTVETDPTILSVDDQPQPGLVVENTFNFAQVSVTKTVESLGVDIDGDPIEYGPFEVELACDWRGDAVAAAEPMTQTIADGETFTWTELPEGAECTITETNTMDAPVTTVAVTQGGATGDATEGTIAELEPLPDVDAADQTSVAFVNEYPDPPVRVSKVVEGDAPDPGRLYTFHVRCVLIDASHPAPGLLLRDGTIQVGTEAAYVATLLPTGAECTITEVDTGGADDTTIMIDGVPVSGTTAVAVLGTVSMEIVVTNDFGLAPTGLDAASLWGAAMLAAFMIGGGVVLVILRRRHRAG